jgi:hypothetical protein
LLSLPPLASVVFALSNTPGFPEFPASISGLADPASSFEIFHQSGAQVATVETQSFWKWHISSYAKSAHLRKIELREKWKKS